MCVNKNVKICYRIFIYVSVLKNLDAYQYLCGKFSLIRTENRKINVAALRTSIRWKNVYKINEIEFDKRRSLIILFVRVPQ